MSASPQYRQDTNPYNSGGGGFIVEDRYAALCLACWLSGVQPPGCLVSSDLALTKFNWQAPRSDWLFDDLILTFEGEGGQKRIAISIKSGEYLKKGLPPKELVEEVWRQILGEGVRSLADNDELIIAANSIAPEQNKDWREIGDWARAQSDETFEANVARATVGNVFKRELLKAFQCPDSIAKGRAPKDTCVRRVLTRLRLVEHDYRSPSNSRLVEEGIKRCSEALVDGSREKAENLWNHLQRIAKDMSPNAGELTYEQLLQYLRSAHQLAAHPNDSRNWTLLEAETARRLDRVSDTIGGLKLDRAQFTSQLQSDLVSKSLVVLFAESGEGKTVCAKRLADSLRAEKHRVVWLEPDQMCASEGPGRATGLSRPLEGLLCRVSESRAYLFLDQLDQYDAVGIRNLLSLIHQITEMDAWRIILSVTPDGLRRLERQVSQATKQKGSVHLVEAPRLGRDEIRAVFTEHPNLAQILRDRSLQEIVLRPRVLDLIAREAVTQATAGQWVCEGDVIDWFFYNVVERREGDGRRATAVRLAARLADELANSIPEDQSEPASADQVASLHSDRIFRVRDGRLGFDHPLLADWSKRQYLVARCDSVPRELDINCRRDNPEWHRGLTLYGLRLIEQQKDTEAFLSLLHSLEPNRQATSCGDSILAGVVQATNPVAVLEALWCDLSSDGNLFRRILRVIHFAATVPHPELPKEHLRQPTWRHFPTLVKWLHAKTPDVIRSAPAEVAFIVETWLVAMGQLQGLPARTEAADLALALATAARAGSHESRFPSDAKAPAYRALLAAVPVDPAGALELLRRCAERLDDDASAKPAQSMSLLFGGIGMNDINPPPFSADAPFRPVDDAFRKVCHDCMSIAPIIKYSPEVTAEIVLATILNPVDNLRYEHRFNRIESAASSHGWSPAMWWRGPFYLFLRINERVGIDLILRLVNYITEVWRYDAEHSDYRQGTSIPYMEIEVEGVLCQWPGGGLNGDNVFSWHSLENRCPKSVQCALMALEHYLYEAESEGRAVDAAIEQIMKGSRSAAFIGLLAAVANHRPDLLEAPLQPLLTCAEAVFHDYLRCQNREDKLYASAMLPSEMPSIREQVSLWYCMKHRDISLLNFLSILIINEEPSPLFERVRNRLLERRRNGEESDQSCPNDLITAWYDAANWRVTDQPQGVQIEFVRPENLRASDMQIQHIEHDRNLLLMPMRARKLIDEGTPPNDKVMEELWSCVVDFADDLRVNGAEDRVADAAAAIVAVAIILRPDWLKQENGRYAKALKVIDSIAMSPPLPKYFDLPNRVSNIGWDSFHANVAGTLYVRELSAKPLSWLDHLKFRRLFSGLAPRQRAVRLRVVRAIAGYHLVTVGHLLRAVTQALSINVIKVPVGPLINLVVEVAALREAHQSDEIAFQHQLRSVRKSFLLGRIEEELRPWSSVANRWHGSLCEGTMIEVMRVVPRPSAGGAFFADPVWQQIVDQGIDWLLHLCKISANVRNGMSDFGDEDDLGYKIGHRFEQSIIELAAEAAVYASSDEWATTIFTRFLLLSPMRYRSRESFAGWFVAFATGDANDELPSKAVSRWTSFAMAVFALDENNAEADELPKAVLGLSRISQYSWPVQASPAAVALAPHFEQWIKSEKRESDDAATFAYFLMRPAAESLRLDGIAWMGSNRRICEGSFWREESDRGPLFNLIQSVIKTVPLGEQSQSLRQGSLKLLSALAAAGDGRAADLQRSVGTYK